MTHTGKNHCSFQRVGSIIILHRIKPLYFYPTLGEKIACFPPENFTDSQAGALSEHCWNNGFWVGPEVPHVKSLYTQPHRYYAFYLAVQSVICMSPIILWNVATKSHLLAVLRGTEEFMEDLVKLITSGRHTEKPKILEAKVIEQLHQFHDICLHAANDSNLSFWLICRQVLELGLFGALFRLQYAIYDIYSDKSFYCTVPSLTDEEVLCSVPVVDLLDFIWLINVTCLVISFSLVVVFVQDEIRTHFGRFQPRFINEMPYGEVDNFNERVKWENNFTKHSYELLTQIYKENSTIMTQAYVLKALKPMTESSESEESSGSEEETQEDKTKPRDMFFATKSKKWLNAARAARLARRKNIVDALKQTSTLAPPDTGLRQRSTTS